MKIKEDDDRAAPDKMAQSLVTIRTASAADADLLADLGARTFSDTFAADNTAEDMAAYLASAFSPAIQLEELADPDAIFYIAEVEKGRAAGYAKLQRGQAPECVAGNNAIEVVRLYVEQGYLGQGVGAALMRACLAASRNLGAQQLWLGVWEHNQRAREFYRKWGFREVGSHEFRLGADVQTDLLLACQL